MSTPLEPLLAPDEPPAFITLNPEGKSHFVLVCDHASCQVPRGLDNLGIKVNELRSHIGWDPGAAQVAQGLAEKLDAPLIMSGYSRLVVDCNRPLQSPESIPAVVAGITIPGNQQLTSAERLLRVETLFNPYHQTIASLLIKRQHRSTLLLSIHSFTPQLNGKRRPWQIGVAYFRDRWLAQSLYEHFQKPGDLIVGFNQPYAIEAEFDCTIPWQGESRGLPSAMIEIRQDGITNEALAESWIARIATACDEIQKRSKN